jgi:hypothetical protein
MTERLQRRKQQQRRARSGTIIARKIVPIRLPARRTRH